MESYLHKCLKHDSYLKKFRIEVNAVKLLTETIFSEIDKKGKGKKYPKNQLHQNTDLVCGCSTWADKLEELYSRITTFLQTLSLFISLSSDSKHRLPTNGLVRSPRVCSLPTVCRMLWRQVETVTRESDNHSVMRTRCLSAASVDVMTASKSNQTDDSCLRYCESCQLSTGLVKMLVNSIIEEQNKYCLSKTHVSEFRREVVHDVMEMSQWGAMSGWVKAIKQDIRWASQMVALSQTQNLNLLYTMDKIKEEQKSIEKNLKNDLQLVKTQLVAEKAQNSYLRHQIEDLNLSLKRRIEYEENLQERMSKNNQTLQILQKSAKNLKSEIDLTKNVYKSFRDFVKTTMSAEFRTINNLNENTTRTLQRISEISYDSYNKQAVLKARLEGKNDFIDVLQKKCATLEHEKIMQHDNFEKLEAKAKEKIQEEKDINILQQKVEALEISLEESKAQELLYKSKIGSATQSQIKKNAEINPINYFNFVSGDPIQDMETQRQLNKRQMKRLLKENADLKSTIQKLKSMKIKP